MSGTSQKITFLRDEDGAGTAWWVLWMIIFLIFGGVAADSSNAFRMRAELQSAADASALVGAIEINGGAAKVKPAAIDLAQKNMPQSLHGDVLVASDVTLGNWDGATFTPGEADPDAVMVVTRREGQNGNRLQAYFLRLIGMDGWNVNALAIAQRYYPNCLKKSAIIAKNIVDFQSNNVFYPGICIHGNDHVEINNGNTWLPGVSVTMPNLADFVIPNSAPATHNPGIENALGEEWFVPKIIDKIPGFLASLTDPADPMKIWPSYIGKDALGNPISVLSGGVLVPVLPAQLIKTVKAKDFNINTYLPGYVYKIDCNKPSDNFSINASTTKPLKNVVLIANCNISFGNSALVYNAVIGSTAGLDPKTKPGDAIIKLGQGSQFGIDDNCAKGNEVQILSTASIQGPSGTKYYGVQMLAKYDIHIAAQADGVEGINVQAGRDVDWASRNTFGRDCQDGVYGFEVPYFRLVM